MREALAKESSAIEVLAGSDVAIPLADRSVDTVFVAQAFHWFDAAKALREIHRVLVAGGGLGMIWNERDESVAWVHDLSVAMQWDQKQPYKVGTDFRDAIAAGPFERVERVKFDNPQTLTHEGLYQRVLTTSYISVMDAPQQTSLMKDVAKVVERLPEPVVLPHVTDVYTARATLSEI
jgi:SAM-dependent methyltransferase